MRVAMFVFGALEYSIALANSLINYCQIDFFISRKYAQIRDSSILNLLCNNIDLHEHSCYRISDPRNMFSWLKTNKKIKQSHYDIIHLQCPNTPWLLICNRNMKGIPLVLTVHDPYQHIGLPRLNSNYQDFIQRLYIKRAKKIIVHGKILKEHFIRRYSFKNTDNIAVLPHGNFAIYRKWCKSECIENNTNKKNILFFGSMRPNKGIEYLIKAEPIIRKKIKNYHIIIAGKGAYDFLKKHDYNESAYSIIDEFIPNSEVHKYFHKASVVVLPYTSATQSGIIPIAYAFGKPVIATSVGAIPEVVINGKTGFLVEPRNEKSLADSIIKVLSDDTLRYKMGNHALQFSKNQLSWGMIAKKTADLYAEVIKAGNNLKRPQHLDL